jgi:hypothetical protein
MHPVLRRFEISCTITVKHALCGFCNSASLTHRVRANCSIGLGLRHSAPTKKRFGF